MKTPLGASNGTARRCTGGGRARAIRRCYARRIACPIERLRYETIASEHLANGEQRVDGRIAAHLVDEALDERAGAAVRAAHLAGICPHGPHSKHPLQNDSDDNRSSHFSRVTHDDSPHNALLLPTGTLIMAP